MCTYSVTTYLLHIGIYTVQMCVWGVYMYVVYTSIHAVGTHMHAHACRVHSGMPGVHLYHRLPQSHKPSSFRGPGAILAAVSSSDWSVSSLHSPGFADKMSGGSSSLDSAAHTYTENVFTFESSPLSKYNFCSSFFFLSHSLVRVF